MLIYSFTYLNKKVRDNLLIPLSSLRKQHSVQNESQYRDEEALAIDVGQVVAGLRKKSLLILTATLIVTFAATGFAFLFYQESYRSQATLLFNPTELPTVVSNLGTANRFFKSQGTEVSPFKNQEEILKSRLLAKKFLKSSTNQA